jgi:hypothetical protein
MRLSALAIRNAKPRETPYKLGDGGGLYLLIKPNSTRLWRMNYAYMGRQKTLSFGEWPLISLAEAREKREEAKRRLAAGLDPSEERKLEQMRAELAASNTFRAIAEEWYLKNEREGLSSLTLAKIRWLLDRTSATLAGRAGEDLERTYRHILETLSKRTDIVGTLFLKAENKIGDPAKLQRLIT